jgi:23S rRNA pseudouridine1911/1915/1917 synthase
VESILSLWREEGYIRGFMKQVEIRVREENIRLDVFVSKELGISRSEASYLIKNRDVLVDSKHSKPHHKVKCREKIEVILREDQIKPEPIPIKVVYEDGDVVVVEKPAGMVTHPTKRIRSGTLVNALLYHTELSKIGGKERPGIVHRLDKDTSGLIVVAKTERAHKGLVFQMKNRRIERRYKACVWGRIEEDSGEITIPIGRPRKGGVEMKVYGRKMRDAVTAYKVLERFEIATFLEVTLLTGRTHQIRVHLSAIGHPVIGDRRYGKKREAPIKRQALHAFSLSFLHPVSDKPLSFESPIPDDINLLLEYLGGDEYGDKAVV